MCIQARTCSLEAVVIFGRTAMSRATSEARVWRAEVTTGEQRTARRAGGPAGAKEREGSIKTEPPITKVESRQNGYTKSSAL